MGNHCSKTAKIRGFIMPLARHLDRMNMCLVLLQAIFSTLCEIIAKARRREI
jgi:hypothetical protein